MQEIGTEAKFLWGQESNSLSHALEGRLGSKSGFGFAVLVMFPSFGC